MARQVRQQRDDLAQLEQDIAWHFNGSPLWEIGAKLCEVLAQFRCVLPLGQIDDAHQAALVNSCRVILENVPGNDAIGDRFWFDSTMIRAIAEEWTGNLLPPSIVARNGDEWKHSYAFLPSFERDRVPRIDIIDFPGSRDVNDIALLTYPWLYHELGHLLMRAHGTSFDRELCGVVDRRLSDAAHMTLGVAEAVKDRNVHILDKIESIWRPSPNHEGWSYEIAIDCIALWSSGPTFIAAYDDAIDDRDPFVIDESHPPYEVRTFAALEAACRLGWQTEAASLSRRLHAWENDERRERSVNEYTALFDSGLINTVVSTALKLCDDLELPRCQETQLEEADATLHGPKPVGFGLPLMLAAWRKYQCDPGDYHAWEANTIQAMTRTVRP